MSSLQQRAQLYTTKPSSQQLKSLIASISYALLKNPTTSSLATSDKTDLNNAIETLTTSFHTPPLERVQLLLWSAQSFLPATIHDDDNHDPALHQSIPISSSASASLRPCRTRLEFARFWLEVLKEDLHQHGNGGNEKTKWLEYDLNLARERLNERSVEVMVREWKRGVFEGCHVDQEYLVMDLVMNDDDFMGRMFEHPIFSLEWAMWRDRQEAEVKEGCGS